MPTANAARWCRPLILALGALGTLLFGAALAASLIDPLLVERLGREIIRIQVERKVGERIDAIDTSFLTRQAQRFSKEAADKIEENKRRLRENAPARIAAQMAQMLNLDCECRKKVEADQRAAIDRDIGNAQRMMDTLGSLIRTQYMTTAEKIAREFRIFTGVNLALIATVLLRPRANVHLIPAASVIVLAGAITAWAYLFKQDWLATIVFGSYVGWWYVAYLACMLALLGDVLLNRARVTVGVIRVMGSGAEGGVVPC